MFLAERAQFFIEWNLICTASILCVKAKRRSSKAESHKQGYKRSCGVHDRTISEVYYGFWRPVLGLARCDCQMCALHD